MLCEKRSVASRARRGSAAASEGDRDERRRRSSGLRSSRVPACARLNSREVKLLHRPGCDGLRRIFSRRAAGGVNADPPAFGTAVCAPAHPSSGRPSSVPASFAASAPRLQVGEVLDEDLWRQPRRADIWRCGRKPGGAASMQSERERSTATRFKSGRQPTAWEKFARRAAAQAVAQGRARRGDGGDRRAAEQRGSGGGASLGGGTQERDLARGDSFFGSPPQPQGLEARRSRRGRDARRARWTRKRRTWAHSRTCHSR